MERFINKKVIVKDQFEGLITSIDPENNLINIKLDNEEKIFAINAVILGTIKFVNEELQELAIPYFSSLKDCLEEKENARDEEELKRIEYEQSCIIRREIGNSNVAFKCTFCNGGCSKNRIGFNGVCSKDVQEYNVAHRTWCSSEPCRCRKLLDGEITQEEFDRLQLTENEMDFLCYESMMLKNWKCYAGIDKYGNPMSLTKAQTGSLAVLTTRPVIDGIEVPQEEAQIFGVFLITKYSDNSLIGGYVGAHPVYRIELTPEESKQMLFWKYHSNANKEEDISWSSGLHRYMSDMECAQILKDIVDIVKDEKKKALAKELLDKFVCDSKIDEILPPCGPLSKFIY